jgi:hypothetical protein
VLKLLLVVGLLGLGALIVTARGVGPAVEDPPRHAEGDRDRRGERGRAGKRRAKPRLRRARCPAGVAGCREVTGRIVLVESVDPDGDGDLHVVVADGGISLPGLTAVDVKPSLRPRRDPRLGDRATAAGPVQTGSFGQDQIHALRFAVQR